MANNDSKAQGMSNRQAKKRLYKKMIGFNPEEHGHHRIGDEKTITVRGVDKTLYDQLTRLIKVWGRNMGFAFTHLLRHYRKDLPFFFGSHMIKKGHRDFFPSLEIIEGEEELRISKNDLTEVGNVKFVFKAIQKLIFSDDIDNKTLLNHVQAIRDCSSYHFPKNVSNLVFHSLIREKPVYEPIEENLKDITVRNVRKDIYDDFAAACQLQKQKIGDAVNELLVWVVPAIEVRHILLFDLIAETPDPLIVTSLEQLEVTNKDLREIQDRKILFHRIGELIFSADIAKNDFIRSVIGIYNCNQVNLPRAIPRLLRFSRIKRYPREHAYYEFRQINHWVGK
ncbi:MAG: hypothetical protein ACE5OZ_08120 [Candidatus Heimdallarchaeota archaeon]